MPKNMDIWSHAFRARDIWMKHVDQCAQNLGIDFGYQEMKWAEESFFESEDLRILQDGSIKVKWEHRCWWADCPTPHIFHGHYYCVLAHPKFVTWHEPYDLQKLLEEE